MGRNFYLKRKLSSAKKQELIDNLNEDNYDKCNEILNEYKPIHIGKRSAGWKFLWNANNFKYFEPGKKSILEFLKSGIIKDEYDDIYTFEQFWNEELKGFLDKGYDLNDYYKVDLSAKYYIPQTERDEYSKRYNVNVDEYGEFYIDDLRFTTCTEFC